MKAIALKGLLLAAAALALASTGAASGTSSASSQTSAIRAAERAFMQATVEADTATVGSLLASNYQLVDPFGAPETRKLYLANLGGAVDFRVFKSVTPFKIVQLGDTAIVRFKARIMTAVGPERLSHGTWITDVLQRRQGRWQFVLAHHTATPNNVPLFIQTLRPRP